MESMRHLIPACMAGIFKTTQRRCGLKAGGASSTTPTASIRSQGSATGASGSTFPLIQHTATIISIGLCLSGCSALTPVMSMFRKGYTRKSRWSSGIGGFRSDAGLWGACLGFAVSSLLAFEHPAECQQGFPEVGAYQHLHDLPVNSDRRRVINQIYASQYGAVPLQYITGQKDTRTPRNTLEDLKTSLFSDSLNHCHLGLYDHESGGHAVVPYRMIRGDIDGEWNLYVYDSNCPTGDCHGVVWIDSAGSDWEYNPLGFVNFGRGLVLDLQPLEFLKQPVLWDVHAPVSATKGLASLCVPIMVR